MAVTRTVAVMLPSKLRPSKLRLSKRRLSKRRLSKRHTVVATTQAPATKQNGRYLQKSLRESQAFFCWIQNVQRKGAKCAKFFYLEMLRLRYR
jgi:hypothetical protein